MSKLEDPKLAFPVDHDDGMSLRDYFAAAALQGFLVDLDCGPEHIPNIAVSAYRMADAMLEARK